MKCALCGRTVKPNCKNAVIIDGKVCHKVCPTKNTRKLSDKENEEYHQLLDAIHWQLRNNPKGYIVTSGMNFKKVTNQIKKLKDNGYSYKDQLYALKKTVERQNGFYGYTSVVNSIDVIIGQLRKRESVLKDIKSSHQEEIVFDASKIMESGDDEW